ncbi:MAG: DedA family protein [Bacteroidales bacterium]|nr:DedA family protein [Bacteroidales bacterium]MCF8458815.1 DedA family protein [Bacteroidales bacterium]
MEQVYAYVLICIGAVFEGELALLAGAISAKGGLLDIRLVWLMAFFSTLGTDWILFLSGKYLGERIMKRYPSLQNRTHKPLTWIHLHPNLILIIYRFIYGFRIVTLLILGMSRVSTKRFIMYSIFSVFTWSMIYSLLGYYLGNVISKTIDNFEYLGVYLIGGLMVLSFMVFLFKTATRRVLVKR